MSRYCVSILISYTNGGSFNLFTVVTNIFVTEFSEFTETFRENSIILIKTV